MMTREEALREMRAAQEAERGANLCGADMRDADLRDAILYDSDLCDAMIECPAVEPDSADLD